MMTDKRTNSIQIFCCYAHEDEALCTQLKMHLSPLQHQGFIDVWSDHDIDTETEWIHEIDKHLNEADIILLLISPDFMASEYHTPHVKNALQRHERHEALVTPLLLRSSMWDETLAGLDTLPRNHMPVTEFQDQDEAFCDIAKELRYRVENSLINVWQDEANELYREGKYNEALVIYEKILQLKSSLAASVCKANVLGDLQRYGEALLAYEQAMRFKRKQSPIEERPVHGSKFYEEALQIYEQIFQQSVSYRSHSPWPGMMLEDIPQGRGRAPINQLNQAIKHDPINPFLYHLKGNVFFRLEQYREALGAYEQAIQLQEGFELSRRYLSEAIENISWQAYKGLDRLARRDLEKANQTG